MHSNEELPPPTLAAAPLEALRYVPTADGGGWQVRCGTDIQVCASLRAFQQREGIERLAALALAQPGIWIEVSRSGR